MTKRFFMSIALTGVLGLAFAGTSQASSVVAVDATFDIAPSGVTATDLEIFFSPNPQTISNILFVAQTGVGVPTFTNDGPDGVHIVFGNAAGAGEIKFSFTTDAAPQNVGVLSFNLSGESGPVTDSGIRVKISTVPEPASLALLGIGMTGFLALRRYFRKPAVA